MQILFLMCLHLLSDFSIIPIKFGIKEVCRLIKFVFLSPPIVQTQFQLVLIVPMTIIW